MRDIGGLGVEADGMGRDVFQFKAEFDGFADPQHDNIEGLGLGVAAVQLRNGGYVVAFGVTLDYNIELSRHGMSLQRAAGT